MEKDISSINQKKAIVLILISEKSGLSNKENYQGQRGTLYNGKRVNQAKRYSNSKHVCTKKQSCKISETRTDRTKTRNRQIHNYKWRLLVLFSQQLIELLNTINKDIEGRNSTIN